MGINRYRAPWGIWTGQALIQFKVLCQEFELVELEKYMYIQLEYALRRPILEVE